MLKKIKRKYNNYIKKMAKINQESFGSQRMNCCDLNNHQEKKEQKCSKK